MGVGYRAYAVIGVRVSADSLFTKQKARAFPHSHPESMKFDPQTGTALWREDSVPIPGYDQDKETFAGFKVVFSTSYASSPEWAFIGHIVECSQRECAGVRLPPPEKDLQIKLMHALAPLRLSDQETNGFGLWSLLTAC